MKIELSNRCNLRCIYCRDTQPPIMEMSDEMFADLLEDFQERGVNAIEISGEGELLVCKGWREKCQEILRRGFRLSAITNLSKPLFDRDLELLIRFENIMVSFDTADAALHERIRRLARFSLLEENVAKLVQARSSSALEQTARLLAACVVCDWNAPGLDVYTRFCIDKGFDGILFRALDDQKNPGEEPLGAASQLGEEELKQAREAFVRALQFLDEARLSATVMPLLFQQLKMCVPERASHSPNGIQIMAQEVLSGHSDKDAVTPPQQQTRSCLDPWNYALILADGSVYPCCHYGTVGSLTQHSLSEVLNGEAMQNLRAGLLKGELDTFCKTCPGRAWTTTSDLQTQVDGFIKMQARLLERTRQWAQSNARVLIYGAGEHTAMLLEQPGMKDIHVIGLMDKNPRLKGEQRFGLEVHSPDALESLSADIILISSRAFESQIAAELLARGVAQEKLQRIYG